jgi:hypothetical protein
MVAMLARGGLAERALGLLAEMAEKHVGPRLLVLWHGGAVVVAVSTA